MSHKNISHERNVARQSSHHSREILIIIGIVLAIALFITLVTVQTNRNNVAVDTTETITYSDALANQYAKPWLEGQAFESTSAPQFSNALANEYAAPWLNSGTTVNDPMAMQYAQPWLEVEAAEPIEFSNALANHYAAPWLKTSTATTSDALAMQYASPWLNAEKATECNGRLDMMYACRYSQ